MESPKLYYWRSCGSVLIGWPEYNDRLGKTIGRSVLQFTKSSWHLTIGESISCPDAELLLRLTAVINIAMRLQAEEYRKRAYFDPSRLTLHVGLTLTLEPLEC